mgnify:CR=1 FL=1
MMPAEKPIEIAKNPLLVVFVKKARVEPIPVARPAAKVTRNAKTRALSMITFLMGKKKPARESSLPASCLVLN